MSSKYSDAQQSALERAYQTLSEQFENVVIVVNTETTHAGQPTETSRVFWAGGRLAAMGLTEQAKDTLLRCPLSCAPTSRDDGDIGGTSELEP